MIKIFDDFYNNGEKNGLYLLDIPTGMGKTHYVIEYIAENYEKIKKNKGKIFFITPLKKNLPIENIKQRIKEKKGNITDEDILFIDSNYESCVNNFKRIYEQIKNDNKVWKYFNKDIFKKIYNSVEVLSEEQNVSKEVKESLSNQLAVTLEPELRKHIRNVIFYSGKKTLSSKKEREIFLFKDNPWISELYPATKTSKAHIILMSIDKFLFPNDTLYEDKYLFSNQVGTLNKSIVFIDEFDASKENLLDSIIEESLKRRPEILQMFRYISDGLKDIRPTSELLNYDPKRYAGTNKKTPQQIIDEFKRKSNEIYEKYNLHSVYKYENSKHKRNLIFEEYNSVLILTEESKKHPIIEYDNKKNINNILLDNKHENVKNVYDLVREINWFFDYYYNGISFIAEDYYIRTFKTNKDFSYDAAISTVLNELLPYPHSATHTFIKDKIPPIYSTDYGSNNDMANVVHDYSFYNNGFKLYEFFNSPDNNTQTIIKTNYYSETPEKFLVNLSKRTKVIGLSATATIPSITSNFSFDYLSQELGEKFIRNLPSNDLKRLKTHVESYTRNYDKVNIKYVEVGTDITDKSSFSIEYWKIFPHENKESERLHKRILRHDLEPYMLKRYMRLFYVFDTVLKSTEIHSFLIMLNLFPNEKMDFNKNIIKQTFDILKKKHSHSTFEYEILRGASPKTFDEYKKEIEERLSNGEKLIVISTYQTIGAGQNLQYKIPENMKGLIKVNNLEYNDEEKDFDGIYLDTPTYVFPGLLEEGNEKDKSKALAKNIFYTQYLKANGELSQKEAHIRTINAIKRVELVTKRKKSHPDVLSVSLHYAQRIIQALGRITRTKNKIKSPLIMYASGIKPYLEKTKKILQDKYVIEEFRRLLDQIKEASKEDDSLLEQASQKNRYSNRQIHSYISNPWDENKVRRWEKLRSEVLKHPTVSNDRLISLYTKLPKVGKELYFKTTDDFETIKVSTKKQKGYQYIGFEDILEKVVSVKWIKNAMEEEGYATSFEPATHIISPILYQNIYKGALGEFIGKLIFEREILRKEDSLKSLPLDIYETFDYMIKGVYIDFKLWKQNHDIDDLQIIRNKMKKVNAQKALIINIFEFENEKAKIRKTKGLKTIPHLIDKYGRIDVNAIQAIREFIYEK